MALGGIPPVAHAGPNLPLPTALAVPILAVGLVVVLAVAYDAYRVYGERTTESDTDHV
ncbi:hypothetical protein NGM10_09175 [Halorussus salilacus]|uniref:hypothetical protein n=1 Tax=Halorussus salilacus TaxID=2953750 RepID=UPI00209DAFCA|nr:hypothetical protein [Halorussus salilacus]USZ66902.1 hypothetical protein NGM10_09175 [Halorussus salilacus]